MSDEPQVQEGAEPEDFEPSGADLVVADAAHPEVDVFRVLDRHDEQQILQEMQSRVLDVSLYDFPGEGGSRNVDLSYKGVREVIHLMTRTGKVRIRVIPGSLDVSEVIENGEPHYVADVWAEDQVTGEAYSGSSTQPKLMKLTQKTAKKWQEKGRDVPEDRKVWDSFARTKAINKAERNALGKFVPEPIRQTLIAQYMNDPKRIKVIQAGAGAEELAELPPALTDEKAQELIDRAKAVYDEVRAVNPLAMYPAVFHQRLIHVHHSHAELEVFVDALEKLRDDQREKKEAAA